MTQQTTTFLLRGGLDLITPPVALKPGTAIAAVNYEPDVAGYTRLTGYERFDGQTSPSTGADASEIATLRAAIRQVGRNSNQIRAIWIYEEKVYSIQDDPNLDKAFIYESTDGGWQVVANNTLLMTFTTGTAEFQEGETVTDGTATGKIAKVVLQSGTWGGGDAAGYLILSSSVSLFTDGATITSNSGSATASGTEYVSIPRGGEYTVFVHNFYGPGKRPRVYLTNGVGQALEFDGSVLAPVRSGTSLGPLDLAGNILNRTDGNILLRGGGSVIARFDFDIPNNCAPFANHLFLGFRNGGIVFSGPGDPFDFTTAGGAGSFGFPGEITGMIPAAQTALVLLGRDRVEYLTGTDVDTFTRKELSNSSGAYAKSAQMLDQPFFLDDAGVRSLSTTDAFGDWRMGTVTRQIEPLMRAKRLAGVRPAASIVVKGKDQYRLFWDDGTGIIVYFGRETPEVMPFKVPFNITCAVVGEVSTDDGGERIFVGSDNGWVYELDKGTSFDGAAIPAYVRLVWNTLGAPAQYKKFGRAALEIDAPEDVTLGFAYHVDYSRRSDGSGAQVNHSVSAGSRSDWVIDDYDNIDWTIADQGQLETWVDTIGRNLAISIISESSTEEAHTLSSMTLNYSPRRAER